MFKKVGASEYNGLYKTNILNVSLEELENKLGKPFRREDENFPDDRTKVSVCWGFQSNNGDDIAIWNYKNSSIFSVYSSGGDKKYYEFLKQYNL